jgi:hypothetical protein
MLETGRKEHMVVLDMSGSEQNESSMHTDEK